MVGADRVWREVCTRYFRMQWLWWGLCGGIMCSSVHSILYAIDTGIKGISLDADYYGFVRRTLIWVVIGFTIFFIGELITYRWDEPPFTVKDILNKTEEYVREFSQSVRLCSVLAPTFAFIAVSLLMYSWVRQDIRLFLMSEGAGFITAFLTVYGTYSGSVKKVLSKLIQERRE